ncbi:MAG: RloB domain-containing protein [Bacteroidetes bacterium]|nr:RloB domain-containing protein [Bacteroidota bacterium]
MKMKDKKAAQIEAKQKHLAELAAVKARRRAEPSLERVAPTKTEKPTILIVCEGKNTEPSYFGQFKLTSATIKAIGNGYNTITLVNQAIDINQKGSYDQVWCVFDKDQFPANDFNNAIAIAAANNFGVAYSNQAFEYWLILHFVDHQGGGMNRDEYNKKINEYINPLGVNYDGEGSKTITEDFFELLIGFDEKNNRPRNELAIIRAKRNYNLLPHASPATEESSTTVFRLVEEIMKFI